MAPSSPQKRRIRSSSIFSDELVAVDFAPENLAPPLSSKTHRAPFLDPNNEPNSAAAAALVAISSSSIEVEDEEEEEIPFAAIRVDDEESKDKTEQLRPSGFGKKKFRKVIDCLKPSGTTSNSSKIFKQQSWKNYLSSMPNMDEDCDLDKVNQMLLEDPFGAMNLLAAAGEVSEIQQQHSSIQQAAAGAGFIKDLKETIFGKRSSNNNLLSLLRDDVSQDKINNALSELIKIQNNLPATIAPFITRTKLIVDTVNNLLCQRDQQHIDLDTSGATYGNLLGERQKLEKYYKRLADSTKD